MDTRFIPNDDLNCIQTAFWMGEERGRAKGEEKGRDAVNKEIAQKLLKKGIDANIISAVTGLSINEIDTFCNS